MFQKSANNQNTNLKSTTATAINIQPTNSASKSILSVDLGRTSTKTCISRKPDNVVFIPANVKQLSMEEARGGVFESTSTDPLLDMWIEYQGKGYALGQLAEDFGANLGVGQSKVEDALVKVLTCAGYFGLQGDISVVLGLPYYSREQFEREKEQLLSLLNGIHQVIYRGESISLNITKTWVMPEGYGSLLWCEVNNNQGAKLNFSKLSVGIVDIGHQTTDFLMVDSFRLARGASKSEAFAMSQFYERVADKIEGADSQSLSLIASVHQPMGKRLYRPKGAAKPTNLDEFLPGLKETFSREMCDLVLSWLPERVSEVILTGGGGEFFWDDIQSLLKEAKIKSHLSKPSRQANALGQYIYGEARLMASKNRVMKT